LQLAVGIEQSDVASLTSELAADARDPKVSLMPLQRIVRGNAFSRRLVIRE
jgi:hypothetical protein